MAIADKIYGTKAQYDELKAYLEKHCPAALENIWWYEEWHDGKDYPFANLSTKTELFLWENCPIPWVKNLMKERYED